MCQVKNNIYFNFFMRGYKLTDITNITKLENHIDILITQLEKAKKKLEDLKDVEFQEKMIAFLFRSIKKDNMLRDLLVIIGMKGAVADEKELFNFILDSIDSVAISYDRKILSKALYDEYLQKLYNWYKKGCKTRDNTYYNYIISIIKPICENEKYREF